MPIQKSTNSLLSQLQRKSWFQRLVHNTEQRSTWQALFNLALPPDMVDHFHVLDIKGTELFVGTENAAWATRLRFVTPQILQHLARCREFPSVKTLYCSVMPPVQVPEKPIVTPIPETAAKSMIAIAKGISDPDLKAALLKLSRNVEKP